MDYLPFAILITVVIAFAFLGATAESMLAVTYGRIWGRLSERLHRR